MSNILSIQRFRNIVLPPPEGRKVMQHLAMNFVRVSLALLLSSVAFSQSITASLQGRVADKSGAVVANATVKVTNTDTGFSRSATSDANGEYSLASLPVGTYKVEVKAGTFQAQTRSIPLTVGQSATLDFALAPG